MARPIAWIIVSGLILRGLFFFGTLSLYGTAGFYPAVNEDTREYLVLAKNMLDHGVFSRSAGPPFDPELFRTPGYPAFIAALFAAIPSVAFVIAAQHILFVAWIVFFYQTIRSVIGEFVARVGAAILALDLGIVYWNNQVSTETIFTIAFFCGIAAIAASLRTPRASTTMVGASCLAFSVLVRPISYYLMWGAGVLFLVMMIYRRYGWRRVAAHASVYLACVVALLGPLIARNFVLYRTFNPSTATAIGFGKYLTAMRAARGEAVEQIPTDNPFHRIKLRQREAVSYIAAHPRLFARVHLLSAVPFFFGDGYVAAVGSIVPSLERERVITDWTGGSGEFFGFFARHRGSEGVVFWFGKLIWISIIALGALGAAVGWRQYPRARSYFVACVAIIYYFLLATGVGSYSRFRFPVNPFFFVFTGIGAAFVVQRIKVQRIKVDQRSKA